MKARAITIKRSTLLSVLLVGLVIAFFSTSTVHAVTPLVSITQP